MRRALAWLAAALLLAGLLALAWLAAALLLAGLLALAWWGWQQGGLLLLMQGMGVC